MVGDIHYILDLGLDLDLHRELINSSKRKKMCVLSAANANDPGSWNCETKWGVVRWLAVAKMEMAKR